MLNFTSNGRLPKERKAAAAAADEEEEGPSTATFGGALGMGWRGGESPDRNVTLLSCRCGEVGEFPVVVMLLLGLVGNVNECTSQATAGYHTTPKKQQEQQQQQQQQQMKLMEQLKRRKGSAQACLVAHSGWGGGEVTALTGM
jgi:hypothetical protein